jgi:F5/8 type C domain
MFFPVVLQLDGIPHDAGDPLLNTWILWWDATAMPFTSQWWNGPVFWPLQGSLAFSEHLVGLSVVTTPLIWMGAGPSTAYSIAFLLSWPLSALSAHALAYRLTGRHDAGFVAGLIFGFNPYRAAQTPHIQVLASWWMPLALLALHDAFDSAASKRRRAFALAIFAVCWLLQVLSNGYLLFYFSVLIALWLGWFATRRGNPITGLVAVSLWTVAAATIAPVLLKYRAVHSYWGLRRSYGEIVGYSADVLSFFTAGELSGLWRFRPVVGPEQELYPGIVALLLVIAWVALAIRQAPARARQRRLFWALIAIGAAFGLVAAVTLAIGPWSIGLGPLAITGGRFRKPLSLAIVSLTGAMLLSRGMAQAFRSRSVLAFNILATAVCWLMCLGPFGRFGGTLFLERPPYFWLIDLPGFNALRVPTRFAMVGALTLAIAAAVGFARFITPRARLLAAAILAALIADAWPRPIPVVGLPQAYRVPDAAKDAAIVELPPGGSVVGDVVAMARGIAHRRPVVNGYSGHFPPPYEVLRVAFQEGDASVIQALPTTAPVCAVIDRRSNAIDLVPAVEGAGGRHVGADGPFEFYLFEQAPPHASGTPPDPGTRVQVAESARRLDRRLFDGRPDTIWTTRGPQRGRERFAIPLSAPARVSGVVMLLGDKIFDYPRRLVIETSIDGKTWEPAWDGPTAALAYKAVMDNPKVSRMTFTFPPRLAETIRLRQVGRSRRYFWSIAELELLGAE